MSAVENKGYQTAKQVTTITENTIKTTNVEAANLVVNAAKIKGTLTASQINAEGLEVVDGTFSGSITTEDITATGGTIGGFSIVGGNLTIGEMGEYASVHVRSSPPGVNVSVGGGTATGWLLTVGQGFGVTRSGTLWANNAHIQGEVIATSGKIGGVAIGDLASVDDIPTSISALVNDAGFTTMSEVEAMGYKTEGEVTQITKNTVTTAYVNALGISVAAANVTGKLTANQIDATNLKVSAANITGSLAIGQLPSNVAVEGDIPTDISDLNNDVGFTTMSAVEGKGYQTVTGVTSIIDGRITTDYIKALGLEVGDEIKMGANAKISWSNVTNQPTIPTSTSQLTNDSGYQNSSQVTSITQNTIETGDLTATNLKVNAANIQGTLTAGQINAEGLAVTNGTFSGSISVNNGAFKVTETGIVTATSGKIGAWTINSEELYTGKVGLLGNFATYNYDSLISGQSPIRIYAGSYTAADAPFKVLNDGSLYASAAEITGTIKANSGTIGILSIEDDGTLAYKKDMGVTDDDGNPVYTIPINITANKQSFSALSSDTFEVDNTITIGAPDDSFTSTAVYTAEQVKFTANGVTYRRKANGSTTTKTKTWAQLLA